MARGEAISHIELEPNMPSADSMERWEAAGDDLAGRITRARTRGYDYLAAQMRVEARQAEDAALGRLKFDADRWYLSKIASRKYGDKTLIGSDPANPLPATTVLDLSGVSTEALREIAAAGVKKG